MIDKSTWKRCALCGKPVHPLQQTSAEPLSDGIACVSCAFDRVNATRQNKGSPSHKSMEKDQDGKWRVNIVADDLSDAQKRRAKKPEDNL